MYQEQIDELIGFVTSEGREDDIAMAKKEYFSEGGGIFGDEISYDMRIGSFLEWYVIDRRKGGKSIIEEYTEKMEDPEKKEIFLSLGDGTRSIFEITGKYRDSINLKDLHGGKKYLVYIPEGILQFKTKNILDARIFSEGKRYVMSPSYIFHPEQMKKFIISMLKTAAVGDDLNRAIIRLANMSLRAEKYGKFRIEEIYK